MTTAQPAVIRNRLHVRWTSHCTVIALAATALHGNPVAASPSSRATPAAGVFGGAETVWVYQYRTEGESDLALLRFAWRPAYDKRPHRFRRPRGLTAVTGQIGAAAVRERFLHVIYEDGTHRRYGPLGVQTERNLPKKCVPLAMAANESGDSVYALVPASVAIALIEDAAGEASTQPVIEEAGQSQHTEPAVDLDLPTTPLAVVRFERGTWSYDREGPPGLPAVSRCWMAAHDGQCHLFVANGESAPGVDHYHTTADGWVGPGTVADVKADDVLFAGICDNQVALGVKSASRPAGAVALLLFDGDTFRSNSALEGTSDVAGAGMDGSNVAVAVLDPQLELLVGTWPANGGAPLAELQPVGVLAPRGRSWTAVELPIVAYGLLTALLIGVFVKRRQSLLVPAQLQPGQIPATFARRLLAFAMDSLIFLPIGSLIIWPAVASAVQDGVFELPADRPLPQWEQTPDFLLRWLIASAAFVAYCAAFEMILGATPGKRIVHCRVVDEHGNRCRHRAILLRNLVRLLELYPPFRLMPAIVLILLTRNRQRLGDLMAKTMVIEPAVQPPISLHGDDAGGKPSNDKKPEAP